MKGIAALFLLVVLGAPAVARADERFAVVIGQNRGDEDEGRLRFAESDAEKFGAVMRELGGVPAENLVSLLGEDATAVRDALLRINERIRALPPGSASLFVFYSGHADAESIHLRGTKLPLRELTSLVQGSPAAFRLLVVDACRSGSLTRVKGGIAVAPTALRLSDSDPSEGAVFLTASAASEDAQESDALKGSFFTHYFVSGLRGAADVNHDGNVDLNEAYRFAYVQTLRESSRTMAGVQHPTYRQDVKGRGDIVLTRWTSGKRQGFVSLPTAHSWLLFRGGEAGPVEVEVVPGIAERTVAVVAGSYFVRGRTESGLLEGTFTVNEGGTVRVDDLPLRSLAYARLVRKGGAEAPKALDGVGMGYQLRTGLETHGDLCHGMYLAYTHETQYANMGGRLHGCMGGFENDAVKADSYEVGGEVRLSTALDLPWVTIEVGGALGGSLLMQRFESRRTTPPRNALAGYGAAFIALSADLVGPLYLTVEAGGMLYLFDRENTSKLPLSPAFAFRTTAGLGWRF